MRCGTVTLFPLKHNICRSYYTSVYLWEKKTKQAANAPRPHPTRNTHCGKIIGTKISALMLCYFSFYSITDWTRTTKGFLGTKQIYSEGFLVLPTSSCLLYLRNTGIQMLNIKNWFEYEGIQHRLQNYWSQCFNQILISPTDHLK